MQLARALVPHMVERGTGHLVFISSLSGKFASAGASIYNATKFGLRGFGFALHEELRGTGVGVTTVFPGFIREAGMFADSGVELPRGVGSRRPEDVAACRDRRASSKGRAEIDVAPRSLAFGARLFGVAPRMVAGVNRRLGLRPAGRRDCRGSARQALGTLGRRGGRLPRELGDQLREPLRLVLRHVRVAVVDLLQPRVREVTRQALRVLRRRRSPSRCPTRGAPACRTP